MKENNENINPNRLINEKSPYLRQHAHNPVDWYPWGEEAFDAAKEKNLPVFLSIGYSSCHWCHVMENESFTDKETGNYLNKHFISIKVDKEERPDVDHLYMTACLAYNGHGGWPLSIFLTPDKKPFFAGTYYPKKDRYGMPGFLSLLSRIHSLWKEDKDKLIEAGNLAMEHIRDMRGPIEGVLSEDVTHKLFDHLFGAFDKKYGGFGRSPKFPSVHNLMFLLRYGILYDNHDAVDMVRTTLHSMARGGMHDHVGGGFCRYSTDTKWLVPHFEKMLYDNAMLAVIYSEAGASIDESFKKIAEKIFTYCVRDMRGEHGGFFTAQDADSEGVEGKYYVWSTGRIKKILGDKAERFMHLMDITDKGNFEGRNIPNLIGKAPTENDMKFLDECFPLLLEERYKRIPPLKDDKVLSSSNGLMIAALSIAGRLHENPEYVEYAKNAAEFILNNLLIDNRLYARWREGEAKHLSTSDDYAYMIWGLIELYQASFNPVWLKKAIEITDSMFNLFWDEYDGGFFLSGNDVDDLPIRQKSTDDGAVPSGNSVMCLNLIKLSRLTGNTVYEDRATQLMDSASGTINNHITSYAGFLMSKLYLEHGGVEVVLTQGEGFTEIKKALNIYHPFSVVSACGEYYKEIYDIAPFTKEYKSSGNHASAYICRKGSCSSPETESESINEIYSDSIKR